MSYEERPYHKYLEQRICLETIFIHVPHLDGNGNGGEICPITQPHCVICGLLTAGDSGEGVTLICRYCTCMTEGCTNPRHFFLPKGYPMTTISALYPSHPQRDTEPYAMYPTCALHAIHRCQCGHQLSIRYRERLCPICRDFCRVEGCQRITIYGYSFCRKHSGKCHFDGCRNMVDYRYFGTSDLGELAKSKLLPHFCLRHKCLLCDRMASYRSNKCTECLKTPS